MTAKEKRKDDEYKKESEEHGMIRLWSFDIDATNHRQECVRSAEK